MNCEDLKQKARDAGYDFKIVCRNDPGYNDDRKIANARFNLFPGAIAYCERVDHVAWCIDYCRAAAIHPRVRSGGHHHEGMCSANDVLVIDLSKFDSIEYEGVDRAWIPPGKLLRDVYSELEGKNRMIPGGGCGSVCIGGLTQGGGWGLSARKLGLTCDNIVGAQIVLADGCSVRAAPDNEYADLFWAIRGGGGGNFGIVTQFSFQLLALEGWITTFEVHWSNDQMLAVSKKWMQEFSGLNNDLTSFCRLSVVDKDTPDTPAVLLGGQFYGTKQDLQEILKPLFDVAAPGFAKYEAHEYVSKSRTELLGHQDGGVPTPHADAHFYLGGLMQPGPPNAPTQTCDIPHPHKISSTFPRCNDYEDLAREMVDFIQNSETSESTNKYLSLHGMGGTIRNVSDTGSAFPYREKDFMMQFQAWWTDSDDPQSNALQVAQNLRWIEDFREKMIPYTEGSFINFPNKDLVPDPDKQRLELLDFYYGINLAELRKIKTKYDPGYLLQFGMSIPPLEKE